LSLLIRHITLQTDTTHMYTHTHTHTHTHTSIENTYTYLLHSIILYKIADYCYFDFELWKNFGFLLFVVALLKRVHDRLGLPIATWKTIRLIDEKKSRRRNWRNEMMRCCDKTTWTQYHEWSKNSASDKLFIDYFLSCEYRIYISNKNCYTYYRLASAYVCMIILHTHRRVPNSHSYATCTCSLIYLLYIFIWHFK